MQPGFESRESSPQFRETVGEAQRAARLVMLDLSELSFIDSSGVHVILDAAGDARRNGGRLLIVRGPAEVDRVLTLTDVDKQVAIFDLAPTEPAPALPHVLTRSSWPKLGDDGRGDAGRESCRCD